MQFEGRTVERYTGTVHISRQKVDGEWEDFAIRVKALPSSWDEEVAVMLPPPMPKSTGKLVPGQNGQMVPEMAANDSDGAVTHHALLRRTKRIHDGTIDSRIIWQTDVKLRSTNPIAFYEGILAELCEAFSAEEVMNWSTQILSLGMVGGADIVAAEESFFRIFQRLTSISDQDAGAGEQAAGVHVEVSHPPDLQGVGTLAE